MQPDVQPILRPEWSPLPFEGCRNVEGKVLLKLPQLSLALLRFAVGATIHEHPADVICLEGHGMTSVDGITAELHASEQVRWPAGLAHRLWTDDSERVTLMVEHHSGQSGD